MKVLIATGSFKDVYTSIESCKQFENIFVKNMRLLQLLYVMAANTRMTFLNTIIMT